jgi:hypothetical protein
LTAELAKVLCDHGAHAVLVLDQQHGLSRLLPFTFALI